MELQNSTKLAINEAVSRGILPPLLSVEEVRRILGLRSLSGARAVMARGEIGPRVRVGRRYFIRREDFEKALVDRQERQRSKGQPSNDSAG